MEKNHNYLKRILLIVWKIVVPNGVTISEEWLSQIFCAGHKIHVVENEWDHIQFRNKCQLN